MQSMCIFSRITIHTLRFCVFGKLRIQMGEPLSFQLKQQQKLPKQIQGDITMVFGISPQNMKLFAQVLCSPIATRVRLDMGSPNPSVRGRDAMM